MAEEHDQEETTSAPDAGAMPPGAPEERMDLPKWNRARVKRKAPAGQEQDAFQGGLRQAGRAARRRVPLVIAGILGFGALVAAGVWYWQHRAETKAAATRILAEAATYESRAQVGDAAAIFGDRTRPPPVPMVSDEAEREARVSSALEGLFEAEAGSDAAVSGQLVRAAQAMEVQDFDTAKAAYQAFLSSAPSDHPLVFMGREGLGLALEGAGDLEGAAAAFKDLAKQKGAFYRDQALAHQGRVLESMDKKDEALAVYRTYLEEFPFSDPSLARDVVRDRMLELDPSSVPDALAGTASGLDIVDMPGKAPTEP